MSRNYISPKARGFALGVIVLVGILFLWTLRTQAATRTENLKSVQEIAQNEVTVALKKLDLGSEKPVAEICVDLPTTEDWLPYASLQTNAGDMSVEEVALLNAKDPATYSGTSRCYRITLNGRSKDISGEVTFIVAKIQTTLPELVTDDLCNAGRAKAQATTPAVDFSCVMSSHGGSIQITSKPTDMTDQQAFDLAYRALVSTVDGPWVFTVKP